MTQLSAGEGINEQVVRTKQRAERAGNLAAASLQRMQSEPAKVRYDVERATGGVTGNERVTHAIAVFSTHLPEQNPSLDPGARDLVTHIGAWLEEAAAAVGTSVKPSSEPAHFPPGFPPRMNSAGAPPTVIQVALEKLATEVLALLAAVKAEAA